MIDASRLAVTLDGMRKFKLPVSTIIQIIGLIRMFPTIYGFEVGKFNIIIITKSAALDNHVCRTLNHEVLHLVIDCYFDEKMSIMLDNEDKDKLSILDKLTFEGYLGED